MEHPITIVTHHGIQVLRDDLLDGGTKSILLKHNPEIREYVYASPVYGGFQIALSIFCKKHNIQATIFCGKRKIRHPNTQRCIDNGANINEVFPAYQSVIEKRARDYCLDKPNTHKIVFGGQTLENIEIIAQRTHAVLKTLEKLPDEIWVAVGSGTIVSGILQAIENTPIRVYGVVVGKTCHITHQNLTLLYYPKPFEIESQLKCEFPSMPNYDRKAFEMCLAKHESNNVLFWNVL